MLQQEKLNNSEIQALPKEDCDKLGIYRRQVFKLSAGDQQDTSLVDTIDSLPIEEAAIARVQYILDLFNHIPGAPMPERMGPDLYALFLGCINDVLPLISAA